ncbi:MAG: gliding motility-associated C-terminal domain-containing protein [Prevotellaceae bacterium]|jgi:gliding motility-associated-like protein|nr:gliding motility-associated C-terminal domain-containing protein [Prevotellaceae bacterium]
MKHCVYIFILLLCCGTAYSQHTTQGKDFWVSFGSNTGDISDSLTLQVRIVTAKASKVTFTFTKLGISSSVSLPAGSVYTRNLSDTEKLAVYSYYNGKPNYNEKSNKSLYIESDENISVYAINLVKRSTDATAILPVKSLGNSYYHISYNPISADGYALIATENATSIYENGIYKTMLNRGEVYSQYFEYDATGQHITANKPVAYFTTNECVYVPKGTFACDCLYEQLFPETAWGVSFMVPVTIRGKERVRILASQNGTKITHIGGTVVQGSLNLNAGQYLEIEISKDGIDENGICYDGCYIKANNPVAVASYLTGIEYDNLIYIGDPAMSWIPSIEQSVNELLLAPFVASGSSLLVEHHALIVTPTVYKNLTDISIGNGNYTPLSGGEWTNHVSGYSFYSMPLTVADLSYKFRNPGGITVLGYGLGYRESYYYLSGSATRKLSAAFYINDIHHQDLDGKEFCSDNFDIKAVVKYDMHPGPRHLRWFIDGTEEIAAGDLMQWTKTFTEDTHTVTLLVKDTEGNTDTLNVGLTVKIQKIDVVDTIVCKGQNIELKVNNPSSKLTYRWYSDAAFSGFIQQGIPVVVQIMSDTVFYLEATSETGCSIRDSVRVSLLPITDLQTGDIDICSDFVAKPEVVSLNADIFKWYSDAGFSDFIVQANSFETAKLKKDTVFYVEAISTIYGCITRDTVRITVYDVRMDDLQVCYDATATISVPATTDVASLTWYRNPDYSGFIANTPSFETTKLQNDTVFYFEAVSTKGCVAKNSVKVLVNPLPELMVSDTGVCAGIATTFAVVTNAILVNWYNDATYNKPINQTVSYTTTLYGNTVFYLEAFSNRTCSVKDSIRVSITQPPSVTAMDDKYLCHGEEVTLEILQSDGSIRWNVNPVTVKPQSTQEYIVTASRPPCPDVHDNVVITVGDSLWIAPSVLPMYQSFIRYSLQLNTNAGFPEYSIINSELPPGLYLSRTGEISGAPNINDLQYAFTVQIEDEHNCTLVQEYVLERDFHIPKIFTPNGDGINDVFMLGHEITIFDRLGIEIFRGDNGWDGMHQNKPVPQNIYFYTLSRKLENGETKIYNGYVGVQ